MKKVVLLALGLLLIFAMGVPLSKSLKRDLPGPVTDSDYFNNGVPNQYKVELGKLLFFDKVLSGN